MVTAAEAQAELARRAAARQAPTSGGVTAEEARAELARRQSAPTYNFNNGGQSYMGDLMRDPRATQQVPRLSAQQQGDANAELDRRVQYASDPNYYRNRARIATFAHGGSFGLQDELTGVGGGVIRAIQDASGPSLGPGDDMWSRLGRGYQAGYHDAAGEVRGDIAQYRRERPAEALGTEVAGGLMSPANRLLGAGVSRLPFGAALTRAAAGKGLPAWFAQTVQGAETGALGGGIYGFNTGDDGDRLASAGQGAEVGAVLGGAIPTAVNAARPVIAPLARGATQAGQALWNALPTAEPNAVGALGGNLRWNAPRVPRTQAGPTPVIPPAAADVIDRLAANSGLSASDVSAATADARATPQGQVLADLFRRSGRDYVRGATHFTGKAGDIVEPVVESRFANAPSHIENALRSGLGVGDHTVAGAKAALDASQEALRQQFDALFGPTTPRQQALFEERVAPLLQAAPDLLQRPMRDALAVYQGDVAAGRATENVNENVGRFLHILKNQLGLHADFEAANGGMREGALRQLYGQLNHAIDPGGSGEAIVPGYREPVAAQQTIYQARNALRTGSQWLNGDANTVRQQISQMSQSERFHARVGLAERIIRATAGADGRNVNVANAIANNNVRAVIAAAFDDPAQAAQFLDKVARTQGDLARNAAAWIGGSTTQVNAAQHALSGADVISAARAARGGPIEMAAHVGHSLYNAARDEAVRAVERNYAQATQALMTPIDSAESETFTKEVARLLRNRQAARARAAARQRAAASGAVSSQQRRDQ